MWDIEARLCACLNCAHWLEDRLAAWMVEQLLRHYNTDRPFDVDLNEHQETLRAKAKGGKAAKAKAGGASASRRGVADLV